MERYKISREKVELIDEIINHHQKNQSELIMILHDINQTLDYIPLIAVKKISEAIGVSMSKIRKTLTFYDFFTEEPYGETIIRVCEGTSCVVNGSEALTKTLHSKFDFEEGKHSNNDFTVEVIYCNGHCDKAPTIRINDQLYTEVDQFELGSIMKEYMS